MSCVAIGCVLMLGGALAIGSGGKVPPAIDHLDGTAWEVTLSYTSVDAKTLVATKVRTDFAWRMQKLSEGTVAVEQDPGGRPTEFRAFYQNGLLWYGTAADSDPASDAMVGIFEITGNPGKLRISGSSLAYLGSLTAKVKLKGKQVPAF